MSADDTLRTELVPDSDDEAELIRAALDPDYEVLEEIGRGGMAVVYRARERSLERDVAIKVLPVARTFDAELVERFQREAKVSASLEHPHIVPVYRVGLSGRVSYFVMKHLPGPSLTDLLAEHGRLAPAEIERLLLEVGDALDHAHGQGVVHRDVKPDNILKDASGRFVVTDFGIARSLRDTRLTQSGGSLGTPRYMSPEQAKGAEVDGRSDFYSLGVVAYHCLTGRPPFEGDDPMSALYAHLHEAVPQPVLDSDDARRVYGVVSRMLAKDPAQRLGSSAEVAATLCTSPAAVPTGEASTTPPPRHAVLAWAGEHPRVVRGSAGVALALIAFAALRDGAAARCRAAMPDADENDRGVLLEPLGTVRRGAELQLSYVVCGLEDDQSFTTRVTIRPADGGGVVGRVGRFFGGGEEPFRVTWDEAAVGFGTARERSIAPGELEPGAYRLTVGVEDDEGRDAEASHDFTVVAR